MTKKQLVRFMSHVAVHNSGCWLWTAFKDWQGYGRFYLGRTRRAHRVSYEYFIGPIPNKFPLDHLCRNSSCVNPYHLEPVTPRENQRRGMKPGIH